MVRRRVKKPDSTALRRLRGTNITSEASYRKIQNYLTEYDRVVSDYERRWGVERLPALVDPALRDRFWSQMDKLNAAIASNSPVDVEAEVEVTLRGYAALEAKAREMGSKEIEGIAWTAPMEDGRVIAIVRDVHEIGVIKKDMPDAIVYSVQEVAAILAAWTDQQKNDAVNRVKDLFPGAHVTKVTELEQELDDEIPF